jgi:hypothetical protein
MITLFCLLQGDTFDQAFPITPEMDDSIAAVKILVKKGRMSVLNDIDAVDLVLYSVSIPHGSFGALEEASRRIEEGDIRNLGPFEAVQVVFPLPAAKSIHLIIRVPGN